ncbi:hypothetical protein FVA74_01190 [Salinibacterium sp. dk2585]|uniref:hypothetical protein n=1 Tax=unclassified Salinibacterium TaxID=2632331 RepID=UPI0011C24496|nr:MULTISPECIES: hypothetical protein [unclassified Salinibacterium]QEE60333.1 hypothetical protein FVA74_01190 [Salinibacterium sp. dk2585]TXK55405.1 hypothetical protein FVP63_01335 [Salinibacterium sp. dk5596]
MGKREEDEAAGGGLDDLFGAEKFREYDDSINPFVAPPPTAPVRVVTPDLPLPAEEPAPVHHRLSPTVAMPVVEEERGPIHDRFSPTVAMPTVGEERGPVHDRLSATVAMTVVQASGAPSGEETVAMPVTPLTDAAPATGTSPTAAGSAVAPQPSGSLWTRLGMRARVLVGVGGGAALTLLLVGLYALGTTLGGGPDAATADGAGAEASVTALEPGVHPWTALQGGECLDPMDSVWAEEFTVVECDAPHAGQFLYGGQVGPEVTVYLDAEGWQGLTTTLCDAGELLDLDAASAITDLEWQLTYAGDATEWANGDRSYGCFVSRTSGEPLTGSLLAG